MNKDVTPSIIKMEDEQLKQLLTEVKETVATDDVTKNTFSAADLWNIQRNMKPAFRTKLTERWQM